MHLSNHHFLLRGRPLILGSSLFFILTALSIGACGGTTEEEESSNGGAGGIAGSTNTGGGGNTTAGAGGNPIAGKGGTTNEAGSGGDNAGAGGDAGGSDAGQGGSLGGTGGNLGGAGGAVGGAGGSPDNACASCIQDQCKEQLAACDKDPQCSAVSECVLEKCLGSKTQNELFQCAFSTCGAGMNQALLPVAECAQQKCEKSICPFGKDGAGGKGGAGGAGGASDPGAAPGVVNCGPNLACDLKKDGACCISVAGFGGPEYKCTQNACTGGFISIPQPCDGPEDCKGGEVCCGTASQQGSANVACSAECKAPSNSQAFQFCHKDKDCPGGETCQVCDVGSFGISVTFRVCGTQCPKLGPGGPP